MALAYATGAKIVGIGSLHGIAEQTNLPGGAATVAADALRGGSYVQTFMKGERGWAHSDELKVVPLISTPHPVVAMSARWPGCPANALVAEPALDGIGAIGLRRLAAHESDEPHLLEPLYVQPSSAERQWANLGRS
jgi:tRNA A37 threonylcarbamoyladenosine modification protein TsaB